MSKKDMSTPATETRLDSQDFRLPAVDRAMSLFELLSNSHQGLTLSELSRKLSIPKSTTHYLIRTLVTRGYVQCGTDGRHYLLGLRLADMASASPAELNLRTQVTPYLRQIATRFNLTATATVQRGAEAVIIAKVESFQDAGGGAWIGRHIDLHCTAQGKALFTSRTISSLTALKAHLALVRANGFAVNDEEQVAGVRAIAIPVTDPIGAVIASVSVRGSTSQIPTPRVSLLAHEMIYLARDFAATIQSAF